MPPIPITVVTGFLGAGKTTVLLHLIPQLPKTYKLALLKNEFGDVAIDSQLASSSAISGVQELLNGCICCNLVGQLGDALDTLRQEVAPDRIIIETSGSAFPATLAMEVNRLGRETGHYILDGVIMIIDVENWKGYEDTSYTAKLQAQYTDVIVFNKWENVSERQFEDCLDRVGDLDVQVAHVKSDKGHVDKSVLLGLDNALAKVMDSSSGEHVGEHPHGHASDHQSEVEVLSVTLSCEDDSLQGIDIPNLHKFLSSAPKDEIYRIKAVVAAYRSPTSPDDAVPTNASEEIPSTTNYILNWAFGRWTFTALSTESALPPKTILRMTIILARDEAEKWKHRIKSGDYFRQENSEKILLTVERIT
jgi:G3E family GTPase